MMPVIRARNQIDRINAMSVVSGTMKKEQVDQFIFELNTAASMRSESTPRVYRPKSPGELAMLAGSSTRVVA